MPLISRLKRTAFILIIAGLFALIPLVAAQPTPTPDFALTATALAETFAPTATATPSPSPSPTVETVPPVVLTVTALLGRATAAATEAPAEPADIEPTAPPPTEEPTVEEPVAEEPEAEETPIVEPEPAPPVEAEPASPAADQPAAEGLPTLVLLVGALAIFLVAGSAVLRENPIDGGSASADEERQ